MLEIDLDMTVEEPNSVSMCVDDGDEVAFGISEAITIKDHNILDNRDLPDQHPISAITGLAEALAQSGKIDTVKRNGVTLPVVNKAVDVEVPTKTSDLTNDSGFITGINSSDVTNALGYTPYQKPASGIPKTDLAQSVQTSLGKADTAIQQINYDLGEITVDQRTEYGLFQITPQQYNDILALWNKGLCSVSCTIEGQDGIAYLAFKDSQQSLDETSFLVFTGTFIHTTYGLTGNVVIAVSASGLSIFKLISDLNEETVYMTVHNEIEQYKQNEAPLPIAYITKSGNDYIVGAGGAYIYTWVHSGRGAVGIYSENGVEYQFLLTDCSFDVQNYHSTWINITEDGTIRIIKAVGTGGGTITSTGTITTYNQTRAITNAEIDAICI